MADKTTAIFEAIAKFASLRREAKGASQDLRNLKRDADGASKSLGDSERASKKAGAAHQQAGRSAQQAGAGHRALKRDVDAAARSMGAADRSSRRAGQGYAQAARGATQAARGHRTYTSAANTATQAAARLARAQQKVGQSSRSTGGGSQLRQLANNMRGADSEGRRLSNTTNGISRALGRINFAKILALASAFGVAGAGALALVGNILAAVGAIGQLSGAAGVLPGLLAAAGAGAATLGVGLFGVGDAFKAMGKTATGGGGAAKKSGAAMAGAARAVEDAYRQADRTARDGAESVRAARSNLADTIVQNSRAIRSAEENVARAQKDARDAQEDLNRARAEAVKRMRDLRTELTGAALDEESARLEIEKAQKERNDVLASGKPQSSIEFREADLNVRQAVNNLEEIHNRQSDLREESNAYARDGVRADDSVRAAEDRLLESKKAVVEAERDLKETREDAAKSQAEAERGVAQAITAANEANADAARAIRDAVAAQKDAAESAQAAAGGTNAYADALAKLSPEARRFVEAVKAVKPAWDAMRKRVQDRLFAGLADEVKPLSDIYLPKVEKLLGGVADAFNKGAKNAAAFFKQQDTQKSFDNISKNVVGFWNRLADATKPVLQIIMDLTEVSSEFLGDMADGLVKTTQRWADFIRQAKKSGDLKRWIAEGIAAFKDLFAILGNIGKIIYGFFRASSDAGSGFLQTLRELTGEFARWVNSVQGQEALRRFFESAARAARAVAPILKTIVAVIARDVAPVLADIAEAVGPGIQNLVRGLGNAFRDARPYIKDVFAAFGDLLDALGDAWPMLSDLAKGISRVLTPALHALAWIIRRITDFWNSLPKPVRDVISTIAGAALVVGGFLFVGGKLLKWGKSFVKLFTSAGKTAGKFWDGLKRVFGKGGPKGGAGGGVLGDVLDDAVDLDGAKKKEKGLFRRIGSWVKDFAGRVGDLFTGKSGKSFGTRLKNLFKRAPKINILDDVAKQIDLPTGNKGTKFLDNFGKSIGELFTKLGPKLPGLLKKWLPVAIGVGLGGWLLTKLFGDDDKNKTDQQDPVGDADKKTQQKLDRMKQNVARAVREINRLIHWNFSDARKAITTATSNMVTDVATRTHTAMVAARDAWREMNRATHFNWSDARVAITTATQNMVTDATTRALRVMTYVRDQWRILLAATQFNWSQARIAVTTATGNMQRDALARSLAILTQIRLRWQQLVALTRANWSAARQAITVATNNMRRDVFNAVERMWANMVRMRNGLTAMRTWFRDAATGVGASMDRMASGVESAMNRVNTALSSKPDETTLMGHVSNLVQFLNPLQPTYKPYNKGGTVGLSSGGTVPGSGPNKDSMMTGLTPGEEVVQRPIARIVRPLLKWLNALQPGRAAQLMNTLKGLRSGGVPGMVQPLATQLVNRLAPTPGGLSLGAPQRVAQTSHGDDNRSTTWQFVINNPVAERSSTSIQDRLTKMANLGFGSE